MQGFRQSRQRRGEAPQGGGVQLALRGRRRCLGQAKLEREDRPERLEIVSNHTVISSHQACPVRVRSQKAGCARPLGSIRTDRERAGGDHFVSIYLLDEPTFPSGALKRLDFGICAYIIYMSAGHIRGVSVLRAGCAPVGVFKTLEYQF